MVTNSSSPNGHILVIDDDITSLDLVSFLFEEKGYHVERCADGHRAIEYCKGIKPDLLIVDLMMPQISGVDTVMELRRSGLSDVPIVAFTAVDDPAVHQSALDAGCNEVLTKPCPAERLVRAIKRHLPD